LIVSGASNFAVRLKWLLADGEADLRQQRSRERRFANPGDCWRVETSW
jgi:hypothetical protein